MRRRRDVFDADGGPAVPAPRAVPIAMGLFALSDWLIYYSAEIKQYSCDLLLTLAALLLAAGRSERSRRR